MTIRGLITTVTALMVLMAWWGCEGPQGPAGTGIEDLDLVDPTVELIDNFSGPLQSQRVEADSFIIRARANDNEAVEYVEFFFDGSSEMGQQTAVDSTEPYLWTWVFDSSGHDFGVYPLMARAFDASGNSGDSPMVLVDYGEPPDTGHVSDFGDGTLWVTMTLPDYFNDKYWNVRLIPPQPCTLLEIQFEFKEPTSEQMTGTQDYLMGPADFQVYAWNSNVATGFPVTPALDSTLVASEEAVFSELNEGNWTIVDVSDWDLEFTNAFHAGFSIPNYGEMKAQLLGLPIWMVKNPNHEDPADHSSIELAEETGWGTIQQDWGERRDLRIRVLVEYDNGSRAMLHPDGIAEQVQHR